jgi:hypothetical protein
LTEAFSMINVPESCPQNKVPSYSNKDQTCPSSVYKFKLSVTLIFFIK